MYIAKGMYRTRWVDNYLYDILIKVYDEAKN